MGLDAAYGYLGGEDMGIGKELRATEACIGQQVLQCNGAQSRSMHGTIIRIMGLIRNQNQLIEI